MKKKMEEKLPFAYSVTAFSVATFPTAAAVSYMATPNPTKRTNVWQIDPYVLIFEQESNIKTCKFKFKQIPRLYVENW